MQYFKYSFINLFKSFEQKNKIVIFTDDTCCIDYEKITLNFFTKQVANIKNSIQYLKIIGVYGKKNKERIIFNSSKNLSFFS